MTDSLVLRALVPLTEAYVARADHAAAVPPTVTLPVPGGRTEEPRCVVQAVVTVDAKGRVSWGHADHEPACRLTVVVPGESSVEVTVLDATGGAGWPLDARGRLQLPHGALRAAGIAAGDRLVVVRLTADPARVVLTAPDGLALRHLG